MNKNSLDAVLTRMMGVLAVKTDSELARALPANRQTLASWRKRDSVPYLECIKFCEEQRLCLDWLLTGEGPMRRDGAAPAGAAEDAGRNAINPREQAILELFRELGEADQREIQNAAQEKKRLSALEAQLQELAAAVAALNRSA